MKQNRTQCCNRDKNKLQWDPQGRENLRPQLCFKLAPTQLWGIPKYVDAQREPQNDCSPKVILSFHGHWPSTDIQPEVITALNRNLELQTVAIICKAVFVTLPLKFTVALKPLL